jgi:ribosome biogenesis GTPase A
MAHIDWFPGHMVKARKDAAETMRRTDVVIEVLDARVPAASCSPLVTQLRQQCQRPALKVLNKADLADPASTQAWLAHYHAQPQTKAIAVCANRSGDVARILVAAQSLAPLHNTTDRPLRMMMMGIPNVGKSTLMNALLKKRIAKVGDEPAITKNQSRHQLTPSKVLVDTPGMLWPHVEQEAAYKLAATHSIGRNAYDDETVALFLAGLLLRNPQAQLAARYGAIPADADAHALLHAVAKRRGLVKDVMAQASMVLLHEFRSGLLGQITLEQPLSTT